MLITPLFTLFLFTIPSLILSELLMVAEFFRHGAREPIYEFYDYDSYHSKGELTSVGMRQQYNLGSVLRHEYIDTLKFLSPEYDSSEIYVSSTNLNRTIISALSQLYGLYPLGTGPKIYNLSSEELYNPPFEINNTQFKYSAIENNQALPSFFQPIPIHNTGIEELILRPFDKSMCSLNKEWQTAQINTNLFKELNEEMNTTMENVKKMINLTKKIDLKTVAAVYDVFQNDIWAGKPLPKEFQGELKTNMSFVYNFWYYYVNFGTSRQKLTISGALFHEIRDYFDGKLKGIEKKKWLMYSAHETTLMMILSSLDLANAECLLKQWRDEENKTICLNIPEYASNILFELHKTEEKIFVKVRYNGNYIKEYEYNEFEALLNRSIHALAEDKEFNRVCKNEGIEKMREIQKSVSHEGFFLMIGIILGILGTGVFLYFRAKMIETKLRLLDESNVKVHSLKQIL